MCFEDEGELGGRCAYAVAPFSHRLNGEEKAMNEANGNGRDKGGRFASGSPGGPGRPRREVERQYLDATVAAVPVERWANVVAKALADAEAGDAAARAWLSKALGIDAQKQAGDEGDREVIIKVVQDTDWYGSVATNGRQ